MGTNVTLSSKPIWDAAFGNSWHRIVVGHRTMPLEIPQNLQFIPGVLGSSHCSLLSVWHNEKRGEHRSTLPSWLLLPWSVGRRLGRRLGRLNGSGQIGDYLVQLLYLAGQILSMCHQLGSIGSVGLTCLVSLGKSLSCLVVDASPVTASIGEISELTLFRDGNAEHRSAIVHTLGDDANANLPISGNLAERPVMLEFDLATPGALALAGHNGRTRRDDKPCLKSRTLGVEAIEILFVGLKVGPVDLGEAFVIDSYHRPLRGTEQVTHG